MKIKIVIFCGFILAFNKVYSQKWIFEFEKGLNLADVNITNKVNYFKVNKWNFNKLEYGFSIKREVKNRYFLGLGFQDYSNTFTIKPKYNLPLKEEVNYQRFWLIHTDFSKLIFNKSNVSFTPSLGYQFGLDWYATAKTNTFTIPRDFTSRLQLSCNSKYILPNEFAAGVNMGYNFSLETIYVKAIDNITSQFFFSYISLSKNIKGKMKKKDNILDLN